MTMYDYLQKAYNVYFDMRDEMTLREILLMLVLVSLVSFVLYRLLLYLKKNYKYEDAKDLGSADNLDNLMEDMLNTTIDTSAMSPSLFIRHCECGGKLNYMHGYTYKCEKCAKVYEQLEYGIYRCNNSLYKMYFFDTVGIDIGLIPIEINSGEQYNGMSIYDEEELREFYSKYIIKNT